MNSVTSLGQNGERVKRACMPATTTRPYFVLVREEGEDQRIVVPEEPKLGVCGSGEALGGVVYRCTMFFSMVLVRYLEDSRRSGKCSNYTRGRSRVQMLILSPGSRAISWWYGE